MKAITLFLSLSFAAHASGGELHSSDYGKRAEANAAGRTIKITPATRSVQVYDGETVHFLVHGKTIAWNFNTRSREAVLTLKAIAPQDVAVGDVRIWVQANPLYQG